MKSKTAIISGVKQAEIIIRDIPPIQSHEVLIQVHACNLCTSEYGVWNGSRTNRSLPWGFGHEWSGTIVETGDNVTEFQVGDYVSGCYEFNPASRESLNTHTLIDPDKKGFNKVQKDGLNGQAACSEYLILPVQSVFKFTQDIDISEAAFLEPIATVYAGIKKINISPGDNVLVIGAGTMGLLNAEIAKFCGARVIITEILEKKIHTAKQMGYEVLKGTNPTLKEDVLRLTNNQGADKVIVAVGAQSALNQAFELVKAFGGTIELFAAGYPDPKFNTSMNQIHYSRTDIMGAFDADFIDFEIASRMMSTGRINLKPLIEAHYPLDDIQNAFIAANTEGAYRISIIISPRKEG